MKVTSHDLSGLGATGASGAQEAQKSNGGSKSVAAGSGGGDRVDFSSTLGSLSRAMNAEGSGREAKVQALAAQYQSGNYSANSAAIGRGLISEAFG